MNNTPQLHRHRVPAEDEIDLFELFDGIWQQKKWIIGCTILAGLLGVGYAFLAPRTYQVSSVLRPVAINELDALNRSEVYKLPTADALDKVAAQLDSYDARLGFFRANPVLFEAFHQPGRRLEQNFEAFNRDAIKLVLPDPKKPESVSRFVRLEMQYPTGIDGVAILNGFVDYAIGLARDEVGGALNVIVANRLNELKGKIDAARANYETGKESRIAKLLEADNVKRARLQDELSALRQQMELERSSRLAELDEAISIARSIGITRPTTPSAMGGDATRGGSQVMRTVVTNQQVPLYFMGTKVLEAERRAVEKRTNNDFTNMRVAEIGKELRMLDSNREVEMLNSRKSEDIFLQGVEPLRAEIARLRGLNIDMTALKLVTVDRQAQEPLEPVKPKKAMLVALSVLGGLILGVLVSMIRYLVQARRDARPFSVAGDGTALRR